jgi:hypothetical protein
MQVEFLIMVQNIIARREQANTAWVYIVVR